ERRSDIGARYVEGCGLQHAAVVAHQLDGMGAADDPPTDADLFRGEHRRRARELDLAAGELVRCPRSAYVDDVHQRRARSSRHGELAVLRNQVIVPGNGPSPIDEGAVAVAERPPAPERLEPANPVEQLATMSNGGAGRENPGADTVVAHLG